MSQAKQLAEQVNSSRERISKLKSAIEARRVERAMMNVDQSVSMNPDTVAATLAALPPDPEEESLKVRGVLSADQHCLCPDFLCYPLHAH